MSKISGVGTVLSSSVYVEQDYIAPFIYADFETSSSSQVVVTGTQDTYNGSFELYSDAPGSGGKPRFVSDSIRGTYSVEFYNPAVTDSEYGNVNFGSPINNSRGEISTLLSGAWSVSMWVKPFGESALGQYAAFLGYNIGYNQGYN